VGKETEWIGCIAVCIIRAWFWLCFRSLWERHVYEKEFIFEISALEADKCYTHYSKK
jgi:sulfur relay (sulfurtransferase) DsrF/TusC family protein